MKTNWKAANKRLRAEVDQLQAENAKLQVELLELYTSNVRNLFEGSLDSLAGGLLHGWVWDKFHPAATVHVDIDDGEVLLATVAGDMFRPDLLEAGKGNGRHGFVYPFPPGLEERTDSIRGIVSGTSFELYPPEPGRPDDIPLPPDDLAR